MIGFHDRPHGRDIFHGQKRPIGVVSDEIRTTLSVQDCDDAADSRA
jgi:hypothetical protein